MKLPHADEVLLHRHLDGELPADAAAAVRARLAAEPALQQEFDRLRTMRSVLAATREPVRTAPAGFTANVVAAARRLPLPADLEGGQDAAAVRVCRRILIAAAVLFAAGLSWHFGLFRAAESASLQAAPDEVQAEVDRLDSRIVEGRAEAGAAAESPAAGRK